MKQGRRTLLGLALVGGMSRVLPAAPKPARDPAAMLDAELAAIVNDKACQLASLSVLAIRHGKVAYEQQFGQRFIEAGGIAAKPANRHTMYRIASISKMMTTLGLMMLVEQGKVALDTDVGDYLGYPLRNPHFPARALTLRALLTHTSSLRDDAGYSWPADIALKSVLLPGEALYGEGKMWATNAAPGDYFTYSNLNWGVIGTIMERVSGERFDRLMKRLLLTPLGLHGGYNPSEFSAEDLSNLATLYRKRGKDNEVWDPAGPWVPQVDDYSVKPPAPPAGIANYAIGSNATPFSPTGGLRISAHDMGIVMQLLINQGQHEGRQLLKPATLTRMFTRQWTDDGKNGDTNHGLYHCWGMGNQQFPDRPGSGMQLVEGGGFSGVGHLGDAYGLVSTFVVDLARKNGIVALVGGTSVEWEAYRGRYSALARFQEQILSAMHSRAILGRTD